MVQECTTNNAAASRPPLRLLMSQWITASVNRSIASPSMIRNSWRHPDYSYFRNETVAAAVETAEPPGAARENEEQQDGDNNSVGGVGNEVESEVESDDNGGGGDESNDQLVPQPVAIRQSVSLPSRQHLDPGWDDTDDSNYQQSGSRSESDSN